ncbi:MAG: YdcF family protein [Aridibacter sp.]
MSWKFRTIICFLFLFLAWIFVAPFLARNLIVEKTLERADAILVLSGSSVYKERTQKAAAVYRSGVSKKILLNDDGGRAGWSQTEQRNPPFVYLAQQELIANGVAAADIEILKPDVTGTIWEARILKKKVEKEHWKSVLIVTSAYHTKRSLWIFEEVLGKDVKIGIVASPTGEQTPPPTIWWLSPKGWSYVAGEYVKFAVYWVYY